MGGDGFTLAEFIVLDFQATSDKKNFKQG